MFLLSTYFFILGTIIGSFLNVCTYRLPKKESLLFPSSHCPHCCAPIKFYDNIPLLSFLILKGRCRQCKTKISWRYFSIELLNGLFYLFLYLKFGLSFKLAAYLVLTSSLIVVTFIDFDHKIVPDKITLPGIILGLIFSFFTPITFIDSLLGTIISGGLFYLIAAISRGGMGGGDIKLVAMIGAFLGIQKILLTIFVSAFIGSIVGITLMILKKKKRKDALPFGPFLALGAMISIFWGTQIINWYLGLSI